MATTIIKEFEVGDNDYRHELDLSDDSISLFGNNGYLLCYDSHYNVLKPDDSVYGRFIYGSSSWLFEKHDGAVIHANSMDEIVYLVDFEVEISKMYIKELDEAYEHRNDYA
jgi:hypothetical protein